MAKKNLQSTIYNRQSNGFTIVELLVAMSLLVILLGLSGMVFSTTVAAHRAAGATINVSRNLRAITDQLNADFRGLQKDAPLTIWFEYDSATDRYYDQIQFFADGDFQTTKQYGTPLQTVYGNMARVYYGHGWSVDVSAAAANPKKGYREFISANDGIDLAPANMLARRTHIFTQIATLDDFPVGLGFSTDLNNLYEYDLAMTLNQWKQLLTDQLFCNQYLDVCFNSTIPPGNNTLAGRPVIDMGDINLLHNLLSQGVIQMRVQWAYTADDLSRTTLPTTPIFPADADYFVGVRWWPSVDPAGDDSVDSDFDTMANQFGAYLKMPGGSSYAAWLDVVSANPVKRCRTDNGSAADLYFKGIFYPKALKFTIVLRDSNGVFAEGKTFTHIVYIDN